MKLLANNTCCGFIAAFENTLITSANFRVLWTIVFVKRVLMCVSIVCGCRPRIYKCRSFERRGINIGK
jgi:hypothetical protein